eukprot:GFUD01036620.1.p2 GENE.GFUD01036620.1~~GFUD01036620.1.p2  ORF type:complete len:111 (+),score=43.25 GFUD01036620.1:45-377(+)
MVLMDVMADGDVSKIGTAGCEKSSFVEENVGDEALDRLSDSELKDEVSEEAQLERLKQLMPTMSAKENVTQLDIILEAIRYIDCLRDKLEEKIDNGDIVTVPTMAKWEEN